ncbi:hypothetical protein L6164_015515 [Bauhinia variegata]|uniref:Uncharacterized protein n=1 Tax=Bauhinia variegata TaxID=167791 RepID=A0ACB9NKW2_BAUVA|nr:hypothetical protein L6164_015515 [Bauhinia variegata]
MLNHFVCGSFDDEGEDDRLCSSPGRKSQKKSKGSKNNNPYSTRGLDKFSALLADLDERRQKIYSQMNPHDVSVVRFVYSNSDDVVPIVIKVKKKDEKHKKEENKDRHEKANTEVIVVEKSAIGQSSAAVEERKQVKLDAEKKKKRSSLKMVRWDTLIHPSFYLPLVFILILSLLTVFGRSAATLCICIVWYVVPTLKDRSKSTRSEKKKDYVRGLSDKKKDYVRGLSDKKKDYVRGLGEKKIVTDGLLSPRRGNSGALKDKSPTKHGHQKSW